MMSIQKWFSLQKLQQVPLSKYRKHIILSIIVIVVIGIFAYLTFFSNIIRSRAAGDGLVHIEPEAAPANSQVLSESGASGGKFIRFITVSAPPPTGTTTNIPSPTRLPTLTPTRVATATPGPTSTTGPVPTLLPPIPAGEGIWISKEEIMALPTTGAAWNKVLSEANSNWGSANLGDNNSSHDVKTLAGALVSVRNNDNVMRQKTIAGLQSAMNSNLSRALELSRGLQTYIIAADIIGYRTPEFESWVRKMLNADVTPHSGGSQLCNASGVSLSCSGIGGVLCTAYRSPNNWGGHARASAIAGALYLNDKQLINNLVNAHKAFIGIDVPNNLYCQSTNWHANSNNRYGVNKLGSTVNGRDVSGVLPEDWRRGGEYAWPPARSGYMWEGMQGYVVSAVMLDRSGLVAFNAADNSVVRAMNKLYEINYPAESDDTWIPWLVNYYAGTNYPTSASNPGKNMGYTDWTHAGRNVQGVSDAQVLAETNCPQVTSGMSSASINVSTQAGLYKVWSRMRASASGANAYWLKVDDQCPVLIGDSTSLPRNWTWVNYTDGNTSSSYTVELTEGNHIFTLYGAEEGVELDKILLTQNITCIPEGFGSNCAQPIVTATVTPTIFQSSDPSVLCE